MATSTTVGSVLQMAFGSAEEGSVDLDSLHTLLFTIVKKLKLENEFIVESRDEHKVASEETLKPTAISSGDRGVDGSDLETRVQLMEDRWRELNSLPSDSEMFRRLHTYRKIQLGGENPPDDEAPEADDEEEEETAVDLPPCRPRQPMMELWHTIQLLRQVENNTAGITRLMEMIAAMHASLDRLQSMVEKIIQKQSELEGLLQLADYIRSIEQRLADQENGLNLLPDDEFFSNLPTWTKLEQYFRGMEHTDKSLDDLLNEANTWSKRGEDVKKAKFEPPRRKTPYPAKRPTEDDIDEDALPAAEPSADEDEDHEDYEDTDEALAEYLKSVGQDTRRTTMKEPLAPATKGLKQTMQKLGVITRKHEALVKRVDELERWLRAELAKKADKDSGPIKQMESILARFSEVMEQMTCIRAVFEKEAGSIVCVQEKLKQLQADVDCILKACYEDQCSETSAGPCDYGGSRGGRGKPDCDALLVRMSWCVMQEKVNTMESDIDIIYNRTGGRAVNGMQPDPFLTMADLQVTLLPVYEDLEDKVPWNILNTVTGGMGNVIKATLQKMLDNDNEWRRIIGYLTGAVDSKLSRGEMSDFSDQLDVKLRCIARRLADVQTKVDADSDPAAGTRKALCLSCNSITRAQTSAAEKPKAGVVFPPALPVNKSVRPFTTFQLHEFRQITHSASPRHRPTEAGDPFAVYRQTGGAVSRSAAAKRAEPTTACRPSELASCEEECIDGQPGIQTVTCVLPMDLLALLDDKRSGRASGVTGADERPDAGQQRSEVTGQRSQSAAPPSAPPPPPPQLVTNLPCVTKEDLREFVESQSDAMSAVLALNSERAGGRDKCARVVYKWPTRSLGSQVGTSLTKLTDQDHAGGQRACRSTFRFENKRP